MGSQFVTALCSTCKVPLVPVINDNPEDWFACPRCKVGDTRTNVLWEVSQHTQEVAARHLQKAARGVARKVEWISFKGETAPKRVYRFVGDFKI